MDNTTNVSNFDGWPLNEQDITFTFVIDTAISPIKVKERFRSIFPTPKIYHALKVDNDNYPHYTYQTCKNSSD